jgi:hypothetical protein
MAPWDNYLNERAYREDKPVAYFIGRVFRFVFALVLLAILAPFIIGAIVMAVNH